MPLFLLTRSTSAFVGMMGRCGCLSMWSTLKRLLFNFLLLSALTVLFSLRAQDAKVKGRGKAKLKRFDGVRSALGVGVAASVSNIKMLKDFKV